jgi:hypothetical protein
MVAQQLQAQPGRPTRISRTSIARHIKLLHSSANHLERLPLTVQALAEVEETWEAAAVRRVFWAIETYQQVGICPSRKQLIVRAGVSIAQKTSTLVNEVIDAALSQLDPNIYSL